MGEENNFKLSKSIEGHGLGINFECSYEIDSEKPNTIHYTFSADYKHHEFKDDVFQINLRAELKTSKREFDLLKISNISMTEARVAYSAEGVVAGKSFKKEDEKSLFGASILWTLGIDTKINKVLLQPYRSVAKSTVMVLRKQLLSLAEELGVKHEQKEPKSKPLIIEKKTVEPKKETLSKEKKTETPTQEKIATKQQKEEPVTSLKVFLKRALSEFNK